MKKTIILAGIIALLISTASDWNPQKQPVVVTSQAQLTAPASSRTPEAGPEDLSGMTKVHVKAVIDGDTFRTDANTPVRLIGIDAPEKDGPYTKAEYFNREATEFVTALISDKTVYLQKDVSEVDKYNRLLRYVYLEDGTLLNSLLIEGGYAEAASYPPDTKYAEAFFQAEALARKSQLGLWQPH